MNIDPITVILFLLFFVAPIVNNFLKRGQGGSQGKTQKPSRPSQPQSRDNRDASSRADTRADTGADTRDTSGGFSQRLEEARRRVQEAMSGEDSSQSSGQSDSDGRSADSDLFRSQERPAQPSQSASQQPSQASQQARGQGGARQPFAGLGREGVSQRLPSQQGQQSGQRSTQSSTDLDDAPPLRVQRLGRRRGGKIEEEASALRFDRRAVRQGVIWRELLDEPLAKRKRKAHTRRDPSQRP